MKLSSFIEKYGNCEIKNIDKMKDLVVIAERFKPKNGECFYYISPRNIIFNAN